MIKGDRAGWPYLRRPFSIYSSDGESAIEVIYKVVGRATSLMSKTDEGEYDLLGPLGKGFARPTGKITLALAGGAGLPPIAYYCQKYVGLAEKTVLVIGARTSAEILIPVGLVAQGIELRPWTEDGSKGSKGTAVDGLAEVLSAVGSGTGSRGGRSGCGSGGSGGGDGGEGGSAGVHVIACGPTQMLARVAALCEAAGATCEVSVEEVMACGVGSCLACAVPRCGGGYLHACSDGPVLDTCSIDWERWL
jgi:dihydroorotate dehydrogenase electron transfer subunit